VRGATSAAAAISSIVVAWKPFSVNSRSACALMVAYWPEFAEAGKETITVRQVLAHQAGLATVGQRLRLADLADQDRLAALIARQRPLWRPGTRQGYHYLTSGWIAAELIRRTDPARRTLGRFFRDEVAVPLGLDFHIGLPPDLPDERVARIKAFHGMQLLLHPTTMPPGMLLAFINPWSLTARTFLNPRLASPGAFDRPELRRVEIPAAGGIGSTRAIASCFGELATGAKTLRLGGRTLDELTAPGVPPADGWGDVVWHTDIRFSAGFLKPSPACPFGSSDRAFGAEGAGGSFGFADPDLGLGYAYAPNRMGFHFFNDPREHALRTAVYRCLRTS
jgi:CubicO group peptidase (beta-lactamase class C family)